MERFIEIIAWTAIWLMMAGTASGLYVLSDVGGFDGIAFFVLPVQALAATVISYVVIKTLAER